MICPVRIPRVRQSQRKNEITEAAVYRHGTVSVGGDRRILSGFRFFGLLLRRRFLRIRFALAGKRERRGLDIGRKAVRILIGRNPNRDIVVCHFDR